MDVNQRIHDLLAKRLRREKGIRVAVGWMRDQDQGVLSYGEFGMIRPEEASFQIGSLTKLFTASLACIAHQRGELDLEGGVGDYLALDLGSSIRGTRIIDLLTHHSGLPSSPRALFGKADAKNPYAGITRERLVAFLDTYKKPPKEKQTFGYSNLGYGLLGLLLETVSKETYEELLRSRIWNPLGLERTWVTRPEDTSHLVPGTVKGGKETPRWELNAMSSAGAIDSSVTDMMEFVRANMEGHSFYPQCHLCHEPQRSLSKLHRIGLGWLITENPDLGTFHWHNGGTGGFNSFLGIGKREGTAVVVLTNRGLSLWQELGFKQDLATSMGVQSLQILNSAS